MVAKQQGKATLKQQMLESATKPIPLTMDLSGIPTELQRLPQWVGWEYRKPKPEDPWRKIPINARDGDNAKSNDPATWSSFSSAVQAHHRWSLSGIGFVFSSEDPYCGIDLDDAITADGHLKPEAQQIVDKLASYTEISPSGTGVKIWIRGKLPPIEKHTAKISEIKVELYDQLRYFCMTGRIWPDACAVIVDRQTELDALVLELGIAKVEKPATPPANNNHVFTVKPGPDKVERAKLWLAKRDPAISGQGGHDHTIGTVSYVMHGLDLSRAEAWDALQEWNKTCEPPWSEKELLHKIDDAKPIPPDKPRGWMLDDDEDDEGTCTEPHNMTGALSVQHFYSYMPTRMYICAPNREMWPGASVNATFGKKSTRWLDKNRPIHQMTWAPGEPEIIEDRMIAQGGWIDQPGARCLNLYIPPQIKSGIASRADKWIDHVAKVYPLEHEHIIKYLAHLAQHPDIKINHALVFGGKQGIGKDTILYPVSYAIGPWNLSDVSPMQLMGRFNSYVKSVLIRASEARDLGDSDRYRFYEHCKVLTASPPETLRCDEKNLREHYVVNVCGMVITTNHKDGLYLPEDDRRHYVAWSELTKDDYPQSYWDDMYHWCDHGGNEHVAAYLRNLNIRDFNPKSPPPKTEAFWAVVDAGRAPEDSELADVIDSLGFFVNDEMIRPKAVTLTMLTDEAQKLGLFSFADWLRERKNRRQIPHRLEAAGYVPVRNKDTKDGYWIVKEKRQAIYAKKELTVRDRVEAARTLQG